MSGIDFRGLNYSNLNEFEDYVKNLAEHIESGQAIEYDSVQGCFNLFPERGVGLPNLGVCEGLRAICLMNDANGGNRSLEREIEIIRGLSKAIIEIHSIDNEIVDELPAEVLRNILSFLPPVKIENLRAVSRSWNHAASIAQIEAINKGKLSMKKAFPGLNSSGIIIRITESDYACFLEYADFSDFEGFDNDCLDRLTRHCPNLKHLSVRNSKISGDSLSCLEFIPNLQSLTISGCSQLAADSLKNLTFTPDLRSLNIKGCSQLAADSLGCLEHIPNLQRLDIGFCKQLDSDSLKNLKFTPDLRSLNISGCDRLAADSLGCLEHIPNLQRLDIGFCSQLAADSLKYLEFFPDLLSLNITCCNQFDADSLKYLEFTRNLLILNIQACNQLAADSLKYLEFTPYLLNLNIGVCTQLAADSLKNLKFTPNLEILDMWQCSQFINDIDPVPQGNFIVKT